MFRVVNFLFSIHVVNFQIFISISVTQFNVHAVNAIVCYVCVVYTALVSEDYRNQLIKQQFVLRKSLIAGWPEGNRIDWSHTCSYFDDDNHCNCIAWHLLCRFG